MDRLPDEVGAGGIQRNFDALRKNMDAIEAASTALQVATLGRWRTLFHCAHAGSSWGASFLADADANGWQTAAAAAGKGFRIWQLDAADYAIPGYITQLRALATFACNSTAPGINFTAGLAAVTGLSGGAGTIGITGVGFITSAALNAPSNGVFTAAKGNIAAMPDGVTNWILGVTPSGAATAGHLGLLGILAQMRHIPA